MLRQKNMIFAVYREKHLTSVRIFCVCCHSKHSSSYFWPKTLLLKPLLFGGIWWPCGGENLKFCQDKKQYDIKEVECENKRVILKRSKNFSPSAVRRPPSDIAIRCPPLPFIVRRPPSAFHFSFIALAQVGRRTSDRGNVKQSFLWSDGWADGGRRRKRDVKTSF